MPTYEQRLIRVRVTNGIWFDKGDICELLPNQEAITAPKLRRLSDDQTYFIKREDFEYIQDDELTNKSEEISPMINNPVSALKNADLDADTLILRKYNFEDSCGDIDSRGKEALINQLWKERRAEFAGQLRALEEAEKETPTV